MINKKSYHAIIISATYYDYINRTNSIMSIEHVLLLLFCSRNLFDSPKFMFAVSPIIIQLKLQ
jgi:hypothetical protein